MTVAEGLAVVGTLVTLQYPSVVSINRASSDEATVNTKQLADKV